MIFELTAAGLNALNSDPGNPPVLTVAKLGDAYNYVPNIADTQLHGGTVATTEPSLPRYLNANVIVYTVYLDPTVGPFVFGEVGLYLPGNILFALGSNGSLINKATNTQIANGNSVRIECYISSIEGTHSIYSTLVNTESPKLNAVGSIDALPRAASVQSEGYVVPNPSSPAQSLLAVANNSTWTVSDYVQQVGKGIITSVSPLQFGIQYTDVMPGNEPVLATPGYLLLQIETGQAAGTVRIVSAITPITVTIQNSFLAGVENGDVFSITSANIMPRNVAAMLGGLNTYVTSSVLNDFAANGGLDGVMTLDGTHAMKDKMNMGGYRITNTGIPVDENDVVNKRFLELALTRVAMGGEAFDAFDTLEVRGETWLAKQGGKVYIGSTVPGGAHPALMQVDGWVWVRNPSANSNDQTASTTKWVRTFVNAAIASIVTPESMGDVKGPVMAANGNFAVFNSVDGKTIRDGGTPGAMAYINDAPATGKSYGRKDAGWGEVPGEAPEDGKVYARKDKDWEDISDRVPEAPDDGAAYARKNKAWAAVGLGIGDVEGAASSVAGMLPVWADASGKKLSTGAAQRVALSPTNPGAASVRELQWDDAVGTFELGMRGGIVSKYGMDNFHVCRNETGATLAKGTPLFATGSVSNGRMLVEKATANPAGGKDESMYVGVAAETVASGNNIIVQRRGIVGNLNTNAWNVGDTLWVGVAVGTLVSTAPAKPNLQIKAGVVLNKHASTGVLDIWDASYSHLDHAPDVDIVTPANDEVLARDGAVWKNKGFGTLVNSATAKTTPVDADMLGLVDSADSNKMKKLSWGNVKATLKTWIEGVAIEVGKTTPSAGAFTTVEANDVATFNDDVVVGGLLNVVGAKFTPASATDAGVKGQIAWDEDYFYVCVGTDTWKRVPIATWP